MPHCNAACSRNFCCSTCRPLGPARPSIVLIFLPCASTASIRHEQADRPSTITVQAPQSPVRQPSLLPVSSSSSRRTSSRLSRGSQRNSTVSPLSVVSTTVFFAIFLLLRYFVER